MRITESSRYRVICGRNFHHFKANRMNTAFTGIKALHTQYAKTGGVKRCSTNTQIHTTQVDWTSKTIRPPLALTVLIAFHLSSALVLRTASRSWPSMDNPSLTSSQPPKSVVSATSKHHNEDIVNNTHRASGYDQMSYGQTSAHLKRLSQRLNPTHQHQSQGAALRMAYWEIK